jgi:stage II sporulation protein D
VSLSLRVQDETVMRSGGAVLAATLLLVGSSALSVPAQTGPAFFVRSLDDPTDRRESRSDVLDTPVLPGSVMKTVTLVAALQSQVIDADTSRMCRRVVTVDGRRYVCAHPDLKRPMRAADALAHSCNDFFVSLAPRLPRSAVDDLRVRLGLGPLGSSADYAAALVGLDGPRITPRALLDVVARLAGVDRQRPIAMSDAVRRVLIDGLRGAAQYGSAAAFAAQGVRALAKTGTAPMPGGAWMGLVVALEPADRPTRGVVVVAPGGAGIDAAAFAGELLAGRAAGTGRSARTPAAATTAASLPPVTTPAATTTAAPAPRASPAAAAPGGESPPLRPVTMIRLGRSTDRGTRVVALDLEDYVAQVLAGEGQPRARDAAQQALAIAARTFALANLNRHGRDGYDMCDTTHCQVVRAATDTTRRAAIATSGRVLMHEGRPATVFYSALCGGRPEIASAVWPGAIDFASTPPTDEACRDEPAWTSEVRAGDIERALRAAGHRGDRLRDLRVVARSASGRVARVRVEGFTPNEISGQDFRTAVTRVAGWQRLKSTAFDVRRTGAGYRFSGRGFGHGVGLCVIGAGHRATAGSAADDILRFYFPALTIQHYRVIEAVPAPAASGRTLPTVSPPPPDITPRIPIPSLTPPGVFTPPPDPPAPPGPTPSVAPAPPSAARGAGDVLVALPAGEEPGRAHLVQSVRAARDEIAAKAGVQLPPVIRVTVHPTVEAFGRATGQPWWAAGATRGTSIELLPLTFLRQQGQLDRTVRHEVAHVLIDAALQGRPLWVREGAALHFADVAPAPESTAARVRCPTDEEFLRPASASAHRVAYAHAVACFRRALAEGGRWQDIR